MEVKALSSDIIIIIIVFAMLQPTRLPLLNPWNSGDVLNKDILCLEYLLVLPQKID